jgi:hypothetical protein
MAITMNIIAVTLAVSWLGKVAGHYHPSSRTNWNNSTSGVDRDGNGFRTINESNTMSEVSTHSILKRFNIDGSIPERDKHLTIEPPTAVGVFSSIPVGIPSNTSKPKLPFNYNDTSFLYTSQLRTIISEYESLFTTDFVHAIYNNDQSWQNINEDEYNMDVEISSKSGFLHTGAMQSRTIDNCFIVKLKSGIDIKTVDDLKSILLAVNAKVKGTFEEAIKGIVACFDADSLPLYILKSIKWIEIVERDQKIEGYQGQTNAPWGLSRISSPTPSKIRSVFNFNLTGRDVNIYVVDSGVLLSHPEFGKRARIGYTVYNGTFGLDCSGHGTEVSSIIGGTNVGVAKQANIIVAQVLDCNRQGQISDLISALDWIVKNGKTPAIINLSVGGPKSPSLDAAVSNAVANGFSVIVAAGNSGIDACSMSPSSASGAIVVGAITEEDKIAPFSNFGKCLTLFAPGTNILAASLFNKKKKRSKLSGYDFVSGTSLAAPFASGVAALLLQKNPRLTPIEVKHLLLQLSVKNILVDDNLRSSPNILLQAPPASGSRKLVNLKSPIVVYFSQSRNERSWDFETILSIWALSVVLMILIISSGAYICNIWSRKIQNSRAHI